MSPFLTVTRSSVWTGLVRKIKRIARWILSLVLVIFIIFVYWKYFYTYSEGSRVGLLQKFSSKGTLFKTYEGELILSSVSSNRDVALASEKFLFTLTNRDLIRQFDTIQGEMVIVHYKQKNGKVFWRGESQYLVDSVKVKR